VIAKLFRIHGRVQGVSYRESMRRAATEIGVTGWVRNRQDGSVEAFAQGEAAAVAQIAEWCRRGPPAARVDSLEEQSAELEPNLTSFTRKETR
jgi:acylphosphatase